MFYPYLGLPRAPLCCVGKWSRASCGSTVFGMYLCTGHPVSTAKVSFNEKFTLMQMPVELSTACEMWLASEQRAVADGELPHSE